MKNYQKKIRHAFLCVALICSAWSLNSCSDTKPIGAQGPEKIFEKALSEYKNEDYIESQKLFEVIKLQYPASQYADDAQFYIAQISFQQKQYILGAFNYSMLRRNYPSSEYYKQSLYQTALCYYNLSPGFERYQDYTLKAIQAFSEFQSMYPNDSLFKEANDKIVELRDKLGHREFSTAELYRRLLKKKSALVYYDGVISDYSDTKYLQPALYGKALSLYELDRIDEAKSLIDYYIMQFPQGEKLTEFKELKSQVALGKTPKK